MTTKQPPAESKYPWDDAYRAVKTTLNEEATAIEKLVADEDSSCPARELRRERAATLRWVLSLMDMLERWGW